MKRLLKTCLQWEVTKPIINKRFQELLPSSSQLEWTTISGEKFIANELDIHLRERYSCFAATFWDIPPNEKSSPSPFCLRCSEIWFCCVKICIFQYNKILNYRNNVSRDRWEKPSIFGKINLIVRTFQMEHER